MEKAAEKLSFLKTKSRQLRAYVLCGFGADYGKHRLSTQVEWPDDTDILLADMPPSTASEVFSFFDNVDALLEAWPKSPKSAPKVQKIALSHIRFSSPKPVRSGFSAASLGVGIITRLSDIGSGDDSNYRLSPP